MKKEHVSLPTHALLISPQLKFCLRLKKLVALLISYHAGYFCKDRELAITVVKHVEQCAQHNSTMTVMGVLSRSLHKHHGSLINNC